MLMRLRQHPPVRGRPAAAAALVLFRGLHGAGTGLAKLGEAHGLHLATAQPLVIMMFLGAAREVDSWAP
jgi:hypothetical protein